MSELLSVGVDVGTTTTQLVVSRLTVENRSSAFSVPEMVIGRRDVIYRSPVYFTPLLGKERVDGEKIRTIVAREYDRAGIRREAVDTGAIIITGETSRKENARSVLEALSGFAGDFVVATAGPDLESVLAARGAGAADFSAMTGKRVLHMDIGGGTSNLAWIEEGRILKTGCLNVGGRLLTFDGDGTVTYVSPVLDGICPLKAGQRAAREQVDQVARVLVQGLEMAAGLREITPLLDKLWTRETGVISTSRICGEDGNAVISFSGGVADCIENRYEWLQFGDMGPILGQQIRQSRLCAGAFRLGEETIRATVIGAGSHSVQLSGSTVYHRGVDFPLKNKPVVCVGEAEQTNAAVIRQRLAQQDGEAVLYLPGAASPEYPRVKALGRAIVEGFGQRPVYVAVQADMAKALGQSMATETAQPVLCIDGVRLSEGSYLDVGEPVGPAIPVVVKTLILENELRFER